MKFVLVLFLLVGSFCTSSWGNQILFGPPVKISALGASTQVLPQNGLRSYLILVNTGTGTLYVKFGSANSTATDGIPVPAGGSYEPIKAPANSIFITPSGSFATVIQGQ